MFITLKKDISEDKITVSKGTKGTVKASKFGDSGTGYLVEFPQIKSIFVKIEDVMVVDEVKPTVNKHPEDEELEKLKPKKPKSTSSKKEPYIKKDSVI